MWYTSIQYLCEDVAAVRYNIHISSSIYFHDKSVIQVVNELVRVIEYRDSSMYTADVKVNTEALPVATRFCHAGYSYKTSSGLPI